MAKVQVYPTTVNTYSTNFNNWNALRNGGSSIVSSVTVDGGIASHGVVPSDFAQGDYQFYRTYMEFDLSGIDPITNPITDIRLYLYGYDADALSRTYVVHGGSKATLSNDENDWDKYIGAVIGNNRLSRITIDINRYTFCRLNLVTYPPFIDGNTGLYVPYVIGLVADSDFFDSPAEFPLTQIRLSLIHI